MKQGIFVWLLLVPFFAVCQQRQAQSGLQLLKEEVARMKNDAGLKNASWAFMVENMSGNNILCEYNADISLQPASVMKVLTTAGALAILGSDFRFETRLEYSGNIDTLTSTLYGNIYITGGGDPTLHSKRFGKDASADSLLSRFRKSLTGAGIQHIKGQLVCDASVFDDLPCAEGWGWEDVGNYYAAGAWGVNYNENSYRLYFNSGQKEGDSTTLVKIVPAISGLTFINRVTTGKPGSGDNVIIYPGSVSSLRILTGTVPPGKTDFDVDGAIPDPRQEIGLQFTRLLDDSGIGFSGPFVIQDEKSKDSSRRILLYSSKSPPLQKIVYYTNLNSVNVFAEAMVKMCGYVKGGKGSIAEGCNQISRFWSSKGMNTVGFEMHDGCGLSRKNLVTVRQLVTVLKAAKQLPSFPSFEASLPVAGKSGGLAAMCKGSAAENNLKAKTGTMSGIRAYAGYLKNKGGNELVFAFIVNNYTCSPYEMKKMAENLMNLMAGTE